MGIRDALTCLQVSSSVIIIVNSYLHRQLTTILQSDRNLQGRVTRRKRTLECMCALVRMNGKVQQMQN